MGQAFLGLAPGDPSVATRKQGLETVLRSEYEVAKTAHESSRAKVPVNVGVVSLDDGDMDVDQMDELAADAGGLSCSEFVGLDEPEKDKLRVVAKRVLGNLRKKRGQVIQTHKKDKQVVLVQTLAAGEEAPEGAATQKS